MTRARVWFGAGTAVAATVAVVFATVGDGVPPSDGDGWRATVVDHGHTAVWVLLAAALAVATARGRWTRISSALAWGALACYAAFLAVTFVL